MTNNGERHELLAYEAGLKDGLAWDLDGYDTWADVDRAREGWDEATINALGSDACREAWGVNADDDEAWSEAMDAYNRGAYEGATTREGRSGLLPRHSGAGDDVDDSPCEGCGVERPLHEEGCVRR
jgi:hypothetical protein